MDMDIWARVSNLFDRYDGDLKIDVASECCWGGELRLGLTNPNGAPARSIVFYSVGGGDPADVAETLSADAEAWLEMNQGAPPLRPNEQT